MILLEEIKVGDNLGQKSKVLSIIGGPGQSGMGIVYVCYNSFWKIKTAVKTFQNRFFSSVNAVNAFKLEALAWINLKRHPFIVTAYAVENIYGRPFLHLDYIAPDKLGRNTLTHYLKSPITLDIALIWGTEFCHAMEHSILHGVTPHRDIKPDNIMIADNFDLKVTDFGLAKLWNQTNFLEAQLSNMNKDLTVEKLDHLALFKSSNNINIAGTPPWMAPEQFEGVANIRSDIYSFGVVLYQMMNHGKLPFIATTVEGFKEAHQKHTLPQFESKLFPIVKKCLAKSPEDRYLNFKDLRLDLEDLYRRENGEDLELNIEVKDFDSIDYGAQGYSFLSLGLYDEAIREFNKSLTLDNNDPIVLNNLGLVYVKKGLFDKAIDVFNRVITLSSEFEEPYINIASAYIFKARSMNDLSITCNAKKFLDKVLELNPINTDALQALAIYYKECENDQNKEKKIYERCVELNPNNPDIYRSLGIVYRQLGMIDKAFVMFKKSIQINPVFEEGYYSLGLLYGTEGIYDQALLTFQKLISINPNKPVYRKNLELVQKYFSIKNKEISPKNKEENQLFSSFQEIRKKEGKKKERDLKDKKELKN
ncbi:Serine/threonine-protein kinase PknD [subsurface metagenome]